MTRSEKKHFAKLAGSKTGKLKKKHLYRLKEMIRPVNAEFGCITDFSPLTEEDLVKLTAL